MTAEWWLGVGCGAGLGVLYGLLSLATTRFARHYRDKTFVLVFFGGMIARLGLTLLTVLLILLYVQIEALVFVGSFFLVFILVLSLEIWMMHTGRFTTLKVK